MVRRPSVRVESKDHDFIIGTKLTSTFRTASPNSQVETHDLYVPAVAIECKTYLDKTMLEGSATAAGELKAVNPNSRYIIVAEYLKLTESVNLNRYKKYVDQIYVLRKQKNTDREFRLLPGFQKNPIDAQLVLNLYKQVVEHLSESWELEARLERGMLL